MSEFNPQNQFVADGEDRTVFVGTTPQSYAQPAPQPNVQPAPQAYAQPTPQPNVQPAPQAYAQPTPQAYAQPNPQAYAQPNPQGYAQPNPQAYAQPNPQAYAQPTPQGYAQPNPQGYAQPNPQAYAQPNPYAAAMNQNVSIKDFVNNYSPKLKKEYTTVTITACVLAAINIVVSILFNPLGLIDAGLLLIFSLCFYFTKARGWGNALLGLGAFEVIVSLALTGTITGTLWIVVGCGAFNVSRKCKKQYDAFLMGDPNYQNVEVKKL